MTEVHNIQNQKKHSHLKKQKPKKKKGNELRVEINIDEDSEEFQKGGDPLKMIYIKPIGYISKDICNANFTLKQGNYFYLPQF